ncbi:A/G-specific adenine glycosylase [Desulfosporosinus sp. FKB]|uniref:A/G-specific adenine glycosylase n=1 Tax=Desulfosporosinus sp. FKB TaxID=1969835 RepID=UPI000B4A45C6|nr:A/G-specific adenine glycosylase [Desulfosporosinus sp. FKB]
MEAERTMMQDNLTDFSIAEYLLPWFYTTKRDLPWRKTKDPYVIWVSEVMLQQTQVKTVIPYFERFLQRFPNLKKLGEASFEEVLTEWRGLGYYSRAKRMWEGAQYLLTQREGEMPDNYEQLLKVPGIGKYTAGAVASIAFGEKVSAIDGNVLRVMSRLLAWPESIESVKSYRRFDRSITLWQATSDPGDFNQALMELGAMVCTSKRPSCGECPLFKLCLGRKGENVLLYPVKRPKAQRQEVTRLTFVMRRGDEVYLQKRPSDGLLASLWELPGVEILQENRQKDFLLSFSQNELFHLYYEAVNDRSFDKDVAKRLAQAVSLQGPLWYNFSHRRWKIFWIVFDINETPGTQHPSLPMLVREQHETEHKQHLLGENRCWVSLNKISAIPLPVAFRGIFRELLKDNNHTSV